MSDEAKRKEAQEKIAELTNQAEKLIDEATLIADGAGISFSWDLAYGMGGSYEPIGSTDWDWGANTIRKQGEWVSSSSQC